MLALVNLPIIISDDIIWNESTDKDDTVTVTDVTASTFTAGKHKRSRRPNGRSRDCPGSLWLRHGRIDFVVEDRKGRYKTTGERRERKVA